MGKIKKSDNKKKPLVSKEIKGLALTFLFAIAVLVLAASLIRITKLGTVGRAYVPVTYKGSTINLSDYPFPFMEKSIVVLGDYVDSLSANILSSYLGVNIVNTPITSDEAAQNVVAVGHPCNNTIVDSFLSTVGMGCGDWNYIDGQAMIKLFQNGDNIALVVAGATSDDTRRAAMVIANYGSYNYGSYKFVGDEVCVTGTGLSLSDMAKCNKWLLRWRLCYSYTS